MECGICYEYVSQDNIEILECAHSLCRKCLGKLHSQTCPFCRNPFINNFLIPSYDNSDTEYLIEDINLIFSNSLRLEQNIIRNRARRNRRNRRRRHQRNNCHITTSLNPSTPQQIENISEENNIISRNDKNRQNRRHNRNRWNNYHCHMESLR